MERVKGIEPSYSAWKAGHRGAADKARSYLAATFEWAIKSANDYTVAVRQDWGLTVNPAAAVAKDHGASKARDRNLTAAEMRIFWTACTDGNAGFSEGTEVCLKLIMACGQRLMETLRIEGRDIDLNEKLWNGRRQTKTLCLQRNARSNSSACTGPHHGLPLKTGARWKPSTSSQENEATKPALSITLITSCH